MRCPFPGVSRWEMDWKHNSTDVIWYILTVLMLSLGLLLLDRHTARKLV